MEVRDLQEVIDEIIVMKDELENCQYSISDPDFARMYTAIMWPGTLNSAIAETEEKLEARENQFLAEMEGEQMVFARSLKGIAETVESFGSFTDLAQVVKVSANAVAISEKLAELVRSPFDGWWVCNQMCINFTVVSQARPHKSVNTQLVPHGGRSSVNPDRIPP